VRSLTPIRFGLRGARRRLGLVLLVYLVGLVPALLVAVEAAEDLTDGLAHSLFAEEAFAGNRWAVWQDLAADPKSDLSGALGGFYALGALGLLFQVLAAAGIAEVLLFREPRGEHPFLLGIGRHGWKFVRSALWFGGALVLLAAAVAAGFGVVNEAARSAADARLQLAGWIGVLAVALLLYVPLDLAYDLSRVSAAAHGDRRTFVGFFRALGHALRHPLRLAPLWLFFTLLSAGLAVAYVVARAAVTPANVGHVALVLLAQQLVFLLLAFLKVGLWGAEIAYYQAIGEPRWCGPRKRRREGQPRVRSERASGGDPAS
jgi:hypothetical protein